ncbi:flavin-containing monoamine oxidase AofH domain protein [Mycobacterium kansasii]|uniref:Flavin-containing monoamine oxidase AofH domain protein n=1 Tax=Mycobacterium kansasii TaxID=1768 RepID=A0A1V3XYD2_MYCKA|nr:flavin-containing monoamine oxidase AofH domain protein [Mycobacterium kansasii]
MTLTGQVAGCRQSSEAGTHYDHVGNPAWVCHVLQSTAFRGSVGIIVIANLPAMIEAGIRQRG